MKKIILALALLFSGMAFSAQLFWAAYSGIDSEFAGGTAYLVQGSSTTTVGQIANTLQSTGIPAITPSGYTVWGNTAVASDSGYTFVDTVTQDIAGPVTAPGWFLICFNQNMDMFTISQIENASTGDGGTTWTMIFNQTMASDYVWTTGSVAVPEPTVMALLALGVAGLALRRKVA